MGLSEQDVWGKLKAIEVSETANILLLVFDSAASFEGLPKIA